MTRQPRVREGRQTRYATGKAVCAKAEDMAIFDTFPAELKRALHAALFPFSPRSIGAALLRGVPVSRIISMIRAAEEKEMEARAMAQIWGTHGHPQAICQGPSATDLGL